MSSNQLLGRSSGMALGTLISRITGVVRDIALVAAIGTGVFSDAYSVANSLPNIVYILIAGGAINAVFIPALIRHIQDDEDNGIAFTDRLLTIVGIILITVVIVGVIFASNLAHLYGTAQWSSDDLSVATAFTRWCIPQVLFYGIFTVFSQVLNSRGVFGLPMYAPIINNVIVIITAGVFVALNTATPTTQSVTSSQLALLGFGTTLGVILQAIILWPALTKSGYSFKPRFDFKNSGLGKVGDLAIWTFGFVLINQISFVVISNLTTAANVNALAQNEIATGFTSYQKAQLMMMLPHSIITVSLITAILPRMSSQAHSKDFSTFGFELTNTLRAVLVLLVPSAAILVATGPALGRLLYGYGASTQAQGSSVGFIASMFALGLPAFSGFYVLLRSYYAQENTRTPFMINLLFNVLHIGIGYTLFQIVSDTHQVASLAIAYSIAYAAIFAGTWWRVSSRLPDLRSRALARLAVQVLVASLVSLVPVLTIGFVAQAVIDVDSNVALAFVVLILQALSFAISYFAVTRTMKIDEISQLRTVFKRA